MNRVYLSLCCLDASVNKFKVSLTAAAAAAAFHYVSTMSREGGPLRSVVSKRASRRRLPQILLSIQTSSGRQQMWEGWLSPGNQGYLFAHGAPLQDAAGGPRPT